MLLRNRYASIFYALKPAPNNCIPAMLARCLGKKVVLDIDDLDYEYLESGLKKALARFFFRLFPRFFPLVTSHTPNLVAYCRERLGLPEERLYYLAQGISAEFLKINIDDSSAASVNASSILYVATLGITSEFSDALPMLARICRRHPEVKITVVGDGVRRSLFEATVHKLGLADNVVFAGRIPHAQLPGEMARHHIGINYMRPSPVNECRAILKIREYLACGLQVVCNKCGDAELFAKVAFVEQDLDAMEGRIDALLSGPVTRNAAGRTFIEQNFSWQPIIGHFVSYLPEKKILPQETAA
jgi:glycosyltransferase involved in cell wall biosynthesis